MKTGENNELQSTPTLNTVLIQDVQDTQNNNSTKKKNKQRICCYNCIIVYYLLFFFFIICGILILFVLNKEKKNYQYDYYLAPIYY